MTDNNQIPWIEKYKPTDISDVVIDETIHSKLNNMFADKCIPNIMIAGVPGIGKTVTIHCIINHLYGAYKNVGVLELNASDDRGIRTVQDSIVHFCKKKLDLSSFEGVYAKHKLVVLDEADNMTTKAQQLINNLMEQYHNTTKFAFTCNNSSDIIEGIQSRCIIFRFKRLDTNKILNRLKFICSNENIKYDNKSLSDLAYIAQGDLRVAINTLQVLYATSGMLNTKAIDNICDTPQPIVIKNLLLACNNNNLQDTVTKLHDLVDQGFSASDISLSILNTLKYFEIAELTPESKIIFMKEICQTCMVISKGVCSELQLMGCLCKIMLLNTK